MLKNVWCFGILTVVALSFIFAGFITGLKVLVATAIVMTLVEKIFEETFPRRWM